jgi:DNA-binding transcriptional MerR regulator
MASSGDLLKTKDVLTATGISHQVLYRYVTMGLIEEAAVTEGGQRLFDPMVVTLIEQIKGLNASGYSLREIKDIFFTEERVRRLCRRTR